MRAINELMQPEGLKGIVFDVHSAVKEKRGVEVNVRKRRSQGAGNNQRFALRILRRQSKICKEC